MRPQKVALSPAKALNEQIGFRPRAWNQSRDRSVATATSKSGARTASPVSKQVYRGHRARSNCSPRTRPQSENSPRNGAHETDGAQDAREEEVRARQAPLAAIKTISRQGAGGLRRRAGAGSTTRTGARSCTPTTWRSAARGRVAGCATTATCTSTRRPTSLTTRGSWTSTSASTRTSTTTWSSR